MDAVRLARIVIQDFRNLERAEVSPGPRFNVFAGQNGSGKTNFVEAVYMLGALRSFRTSTRSELVSHGKEMTRVEGLFGGAGKGLVCEVAVRSDGRRVRVDGKPVARVGGHYRTLPMVLFHPANLTLVQGGPETRRRFVDRALFQADAAYPELHREYGKALASRNRLLKERRQDRRALEAFEDQIAKLGARITACRAWFIGMLGERFAHAFREVSGGLEAGVTYRPSVEGGEQELALALRQGRARDEAAGFTASGPHADDFEIAIAGRSARRFASQGQQRALVLSMKIAETRALFEAVGRIPLLLLDDVTSELDRTRNRHLFRFLADEAGQVFITTTHADHILIEIDRTDFVVDGGRITTGSART
ncbi:MAG: DNA replication/repair protein RecF [Deltaproteobacteria bacterium]|nr:DNA replication/repair protein RecF [Deltaproteobacteria bacterium]